MHTYLYNETKVNNARVVRKIHKMQQKTQLFALWLLLCAWTWIQGIDGDDIGGDFLIGVGSYDMTGPAADVNMMGYGNLDQNSAGIHFRLRARTFIVADHGQSQSQRFVFVNLDSCMASQLITIKVLQRLKSRYTISNQTILSY